MERALDHHRLGRGAAEQLEQARLVGLGGRQRQSLAEADEVMRVLDHVVAEPVEVERSGLEVDVEPHVADRGVE